MCVCVYVWDMYMYICMYVFLLKRKPPVACFLHNNIKRSNMLSAMLGFDCFSSLLSNLHVCLTICEFPRFQLDYRFILLVLFSMYNFIMDFIITVAHSLGFPGGLYFGLILPFSTVCLINFNGIAHVCTHWRRFVSHILLRFQRFSRNSHSFFFSKFHFGFSL